MDSFSGIDLFDILEEQLKKLNDMQNTTTILKCTDERSVKEEIEDIYLTTYRITKDIDTLRKNLDTMIEKNVQMQTLLELFNDLDKKIEHMQQNFPSILEDLGTTMNEDLQNCNTYSPDKAMENNCLSKPTNTQELSSNTADSQNKGSLSCKKPLFKEFDVCTGIELLSQEEFNKIPKYIIGRNTIITVNTLIKSINEVLKDKYSLLALGKIKAKKKGELDRYLNYKKEEMTVNTEKGQVTQFFTAQDYNKYTKMKLDKTKLNLLTALKFCKRIEFIKVGKELFYEIIQKD